MSADDEVTDCCLADLFVRIFQLTPAVKLLQFPMAANFSLLLSAPLKRTKEKGKKTASSVSRKSYNRTSYILWPGDLLCMVKN